MVDKIVPGWQFSVKIPGICIRERTQPEIPLIGVVRIELEIRVLFLRGLQQRGIFEAIAEAKGAVVMEVVAQKHVCRAGLLGCCFQRRMGVEQGHCGCPPCIRDAADSDLPVVIADVVNEPFDSVISIGCLIDGQHLIECARMPPTTQHQPEML